MLILLPIFPYLKALLQYLLYLYTIIPYGLHKCPFFFGSQIFLQCLLHEDLHFYSLSLHSFQFLIVLPNLLFELLDLLL